MPNWVTNILTINADEKMVEQILSEVKSETNEFDFNLILPMPDELEGGSSPTYIVSQEEYENDSSKGMTKAMSDELIKKYGFDNWYNWRIHNWDTKWNSDEVYINYNEITFDTAWSNPKALLVALSEKYPTIKFQIKFADEDFGFNVGEYTLLNGEPIEFDFPDGGSDEAYLMAMDIHCDSDYYFNEFLYNIDEDEELGDFEKTIIRLSYKEKNSVNDNMSIIVLNEFLSLALAEENYEYADEVKKVIESKESIES